jgi:hypothetical protein
LGTGVSSTWKAQRWTALSVPAEPPITPQSMFAVSPGYRTPSCANGTSASSGRLEGSAPANGVWLYAQVRRSTVSSLLSVRRLPVSRYDVGALTWYEILND